MDLEGAVPPVNGPRERELYLPANVSSTPGGQWTERVLRVGSLAEGAKLAREWIEERLQRGA